MTDFHDWQSENMRREGVSMDSVRNAVRTLHALRFKRSDRDGSTISEIEHTIVFLYNEYKDMVMPGETWICSTHFTGNVYKAAPLVKVTASMLMELDDTMRREIVAELWKANRRNYEAAFETKYKDEIYKEARNEAREENEEIVSKLNNEIADLRKQLDLSNFMIRSGSGKEDDGIELSSQQPGETVAQSMPITVGTQYEEYRPDNFAIPRAMNVPGLPETTTYPRERMRMGHVKIQIERASEETLKSDSFSPGKYFAHISPSKRYLVLRPHEFGSAICIDGRIRLDGLGDYSPFTGRKMMEAEYNPRYEGILVYL